jgi:hypothetical protein
MISRHTNHLTRLRQYKSRIEKWNLEKNVKSREMQAIVRKHQQRKLQEPSRPELLFYVRGHKVSQSKIERWIHDNGVSGSALSAPSPAACKSLGPVDSISLYAKATPSVIDCRTISEPGTSASRSTTQIPVFHNFPSESAVKSGFENHSNSNPSSPRSRSPTPTPTSYEYPTSSATRDGSNTMNYDNSEEAAIQVSIGRMQIPALIFNPEPRPSSVSRIIHLDNVLTAWRVFSFKKYAPDLSQREIQLCYCKHLTNRYILSSSDSNLALRALFDLVGNNYLFIPAYSDTTKILRIKLDYWLNIGYNMNERNSSGYTFFLSACKHSYMTMTSYRDWADFLSLLIECGADVHSTHLYNGRGALHLLLDGIEYWSIYSHKRRETKDLLVVLLNAGCDPDARDSEGRTPLEFANVPRSSYRWNEWEEALAETSDTRRLLAEQRGSTSYGSVVEM